MAQEYVLGTDADESMRLAIQHRVWGDASVAAWKRAGIMPGSRVLDLGSGPGHASLDLAQLVGPQGEVLAFDQSPEFLENLRTKAEALGLSQIKIQQGDGQDFGPEHLGTFDFIYCRWVLCWLKEPTLAIANMKRVLKPKGKIIIHDYFNWKSMCLAPRSAAIEKLVLAAVKSFEVRHGNVDIAGDLPKLLREKKLEILHFDIHQRAARGGGLDATGAWPITWWRSYAPKLVPLGFLSEQDCRASLSAIDEYEKNADYFFFCPPLFEFIAGHS